MSASITDILADVAAERDIVASAVTLVDGLAGQVGALRASLDTAVAQLKANGDAAALGVTQDMLTSIHEGLQANRATLAAAITANTPAAPAPAPTPDPTPAPTA